MQNPTDQAEAEASNNGLNLNRTVTVRRNAAKRTHPFDLAAEELHLVPSSSLSSPQAEDIPPARKKPRLEEPLPTIIDEATGKTASPDVSVGLLLATHRIAPVRASRVYLFVVCCFHWTRVILVYR